MDMRRLITLVESSTQPLDEIESAGGVDHSYVDDLSDKNYQADHAEYAGQQELFPGAFPDLAKLHATLKKPYKLLGKIDGLMFGLKTDEKNDTTYVLFDEGRPIAWVSIKKPEGQARNADLHGEGGQVQGVHVRDEYLGRGLGMKMYLFLLTNVYDYILADNNQTRDAQHMWRKMLYSKLFDVLVYNQNTGESARRTGKKWDVVYTSMSSFNYVPWVTLKGNADNVRWGDD